MASGSRSNTRSLDRSIPSLLRSSTSVYPHSALRTGRRSKSERSARDSARSRSNLGSPPSHSRLSVNTSLSRGTGENSLANEDDPCVCGPDFYANVLGPTADETILVGLQTFWSLCKECPPSNNTDGDGTAIESPRGSARRSARDVNRNVSSRTNLGSGERSWANLSKEGRSKTNLTTDGRSRSTLGADGGSSRRDLGSDARSKSRETMGSPGRSIGRSSMEVKGKGSPERRRRSSDGSGWRDDMRGNESSATLRRRTMGSPRSNGRRSMEVKGKGSPERRQKSSDGSGWRDDMRGNGSRANLRRGKIAAGGESSMTLGSKPRGGTTVNARALTNPSFNRRVSIQSRTSLADDEGNEDGDLQVEVEIQDDDELDEEELDLEDEELMAEEEYWADKEIQTSKHSKMFQVDIDIINTSDESQTDYPEIDNGSQTHNSGNDSSQTSSCSSTVGAQTCRPTTTDSSRCHKNTKPSSCLRRSQQPQRNKLTGACTCCPYSGSDETTASADIVICKCSSCKLKARQRFPEKVNSSCVCKPPARTCPLAPKKQVRVCEDSAGSCTTDNDMSCNCTDDNDQPQAGDTNRSKVRYAITKITKFVSYTTFEVMKSTRKKPKFMPKGLEGVFVLKNVTGCNS